MDDERANPSPALLPQTRTLCEQAIELFERYQACLPTGLYQPGSPASDTAAYSTRQFGPTVRWDRWPVDQVTLRSFAYCSLNLQHFAALATLLEYRPHGLPFGPLVRSVAEAAGRCIWLLDPRLTDDFGFKGSVRPRVARGFLDIEDDVGRLKTIAYAFDHPDRAKLGDQHRIARDRIARATHFYLPELKFDKQGNSTVCGQKLPGPSEFVTLAEASLHTGRGAAASTYSYLSLMTHPSVSAFIESLDIRGGPPGSSTVEVRKDEAFTTKLVLHGVSCFCDAWRSFTSWCETGHDEVNQLIDAHNALHNQVPED